MKRRGIQLLALIGVVALVALAAGCQKRAAAQERTAESLQIPGVTSAVRDIYDNYAAAAVAGDADRWIALWDEAGVQLPPNEPIVVGRDAIEARARDNIGPGQVSEFNIQIHDVHTDGNLAVARGVYTVTMTEAAGGGQVDGKYLTVFRKQSDGSWKIFRDCFNSNLPVGE